MAITIPGKSLEIDTSSQTLFPLIPQVAGLTRGIVDEDAGDLLECPNCEELYSPSIGYCTKCFYQDENTFQLDVFGAEEKYIKFERDGVYDYDFSHGLFKSSKINFLDGMIREVNFTYLQDNYRVSISGFFPGFKISIDKEEMGKFRYHYAKRTHFDQIRNFIYVLLKDYKDKQN